MSDQMASSKETIYDSLNKMADLQHKIWSDWIRHMVDVGTVNDDGSITIPADKAVVWVAASSRAHDDLYKPDHDNKFGDVRSRGIGAAVTALAGMRPLDIIRQQTDFFVGPGRWQQWQEWFDAGRQVLAENLNVELGKSGEEPWLTDHWLEWLTLADLLSRLPVGAPFIFTVLDDRRIAFDLESLARREAWLAREKES